MTRKRQSGRCYIWRKVQKRKDVLSPFLSAVRPETPPEGLLQSIEREIESTGNNPGTRRRRAWVFAMLPLTAAVAIAGIVILGAVFPTDRTDLLDRAGRLVARLETRGEITTVRLFGVGLAVESQKSWHLWGIVSTEESPIHLGVIAAGETFLDSPERFSGFSISLEDNSFSGTSPAGPVLPLFGKK